MAEVDIDYLAVLHTHTHTHTTTTTLTAPQPLPRPIYSTWEGEGGMRGRGRLGKRCEVRVK